MKKNKNLNLTLIFCIVIFFTISITSIYSASSILPNIYSNLYIKQIMWYGVGILVFILLLFIGNEKILRYSNYLYLISIILLVLVLIFGNEVNNTKGWFTIFGINFQPSEFAKISLLLYLSKIINNFHFEDKKNFKNEIKLIFKIFLVTLLPSILVFLEPDTGAVISYFVIAISMIFISEIRLRWNIILLLIFFSFILLFILLYNKYPEVISNVMGNNFYYRLFRIVDWKANSGMQLENSLIAIGTSGLFGHGFNNIPIYFPEPYTDFIFSVYASNYGLIGSLLLILLIILFDIKIIKIGYKNSKTINKYIAMGVLVYFFLQQLWNVAMTIGVTPIMGVTLPFISYGGSSLIASFILLALIFNISNDNGDDLLSDSLLQA